MVKQKEIKIKYPEARVRAINSNLAKKNTTIEVEIMESLNQIYKKHVKPEVREFIEELEGDEPVVSKKPRTIIALFIEIWNKYANFICLKTCALILKIFQNRWIECPIWIEK